MTYQIGQIVPLDYPRGIVSGPQTEPTWHVLIVAPGKERAVREYLRARDVYAFYPSEAKIRHVRGLKIETERPIVARQVYAQFRQAPQWDVMQRQRRLITGVFCINGWPVTIPADIIRHLQGLTVEAERLRAARAELLRVRPGDIAVIQDGPMKGFRVEVFDVKGGEAWFAFLSGGKGRASLHILERDVPNALI